MHDIEYLESRRIKIDYAKKVKYNFNSNEAFNNLSGYGIPKKCETFNCSATDVKSLIGGPESVSGVYDCSDNLLTSLEGIPNNVGLIDCENNKLLTSLKGCPEIVGTDLMANDCAITHLRYGPKSVGAMKLFKNPITTLCGVNDSIKRCKSMYLGNAPIIEGGIGLLLIDGLKHVNCVSGTSDWYKAFLIIRQYIGDNDNGSGKHRILECQEELEEAGLEAFAKL